MGSSNNALEVTMTRYPIVAFLLNFFFPGAGYLYIGRRVLLAIGWLIGAVGLTYVEFGIKEAAPAYYWPMFAAVLLMNTMFAIDAWRETKAIRGQQAAA
jgi:hypothetical protein